MSLNVMMRPLSIVLVLGLLFAVTACDRSNDYSPDGSDITEENVTRVLSVLAADDMRGRDAFSPDALRAAQFISDEFAAIGLEKLEGGEDYLQRFPIYSVATEAVSVSLNGTAIAADDVAASLAADGIAWTEENGPVVTSVGAEDNLMQVFQEVRRTGGDVLLVVHSAQAETFQRLKSFASRASRTTDLGAGTNLVIVLSDETDVSSYVVDATASVSETPLANVVGIIPGSRPDEVVVFSGHYDHIGIRPAVDGDSIANGANDDASGTAAVIELARHFSKMGKPERTVMFVAFTAEESGGYGSRHFSEQLDPDQIVAMFNIEMIGKGAEEGPNTAWITGFERSDFGAILQRAVEGTLYEFYPDPYPEQNLFFRSDNATLARLGVPAHSISTTPLDVDGDYHNVSDEIETLDMPHLTNTIRAIASGAATIISGAETPTRIDPDSVNR